MVQRNTAIRPPTRVFENEEIHPFECCSFPYPQSMRSQAIHNRITGVDMPENHHFDILRKNGLYPSEWSVDRWMICRNEYNHCTPPFRRTGNK